MVTALPLCPAQSLDPLCPWDSVTFSVKEKGQIGYCPLSVTVYDFMDDGELKPPILILLGKERTRLSIKMQ